MAERDMIMVTRSARVGSRQPTQHPIRYLIHPAGLVLLGVLTATACGQSRPFHYFQQANMPPGAIGQAQLLRGGPWAGYLQPVEITAPPGVQISLAMDNMYDPPQPAPARAALLVGRVYRLKVINIPNQEGQEVYPSVEIINRLYPPAGQEVRFPIPIELTQEELELALRGRFVTRVIYLEDPRAALPEREDPNRQRYWEVAPTQDPLQVADRLGRPMAILRLGSRIPEMNETTGQFLFDTPPWIRLPAMPVAPPPPEGGREVTTGYQPPTEPNSVGTTAYPGSATARPSTPPRGIE